MAKTGKRLTKAYEGIDPEAAPLRVDAAVKEIKSRASAKFDETVEIAMNLNLDPRKPDQNLRGTVMLPHGTGKSVRVAVFARGDRAKEAEAAGADVVGADLLAKPLPSSASGVEVVVGSRDLLAPAHGGWDANSMKSSALIPNVIRARRLPRTIALHRRRPGTKIGPDDDPRL